MARPTQLRRRLRTPRLRPQPAETLQLDHRQATAADSRKEPLDVILGRRLNVGRSPELLRQLCQTRLFNFYDDDSDLAPPGEALQKPRRGTVAKHDGRLVFVLDTFSRFRVPTADIAELSQQEASQFSMGRVSSVPLSELAEVRGARVEIARRGVILVHTAAPTSGTEDAGRTALDLMAAVLQHLQDDLQTFAAQRHMPVGRIPVIYPQAARDHEAFARAHGEIHNIASVSRNTQPSFVLDMPFPQEFQSPSWRCSTCKNTGRPNFKHFPCPQLCCLFTSPLPGALCDRLPLQRLSGCKPGALQQYFVVTDDDICAAFPEALVYREDRQRPCYFTPRWFFHLAKHFYETLNARSARRALSHWYVAAALHGSVYMDFRGSAPSLAWQVSSLPKNAVIRGILLQGLATLVQAQVTRMKRRQLLYNSKGMRVDGNYKIAKRLQFDDEEPPTVVLGFCGTDGSLLDLLTPSVGEWWEPIKTVLLPLLQDIRATFLNAGFTAQEAREWLIYAGGALLLKMPL